MKSWLKAQHSENKDHGIWSHDFMGNRWGNSGNSVRLYFWGSKITADGNCSHEIKRCLLHGRKVMTNLDSILKSRDITLSAKVHLVKAMVFPVVMYGCDESEIAQSCLTLCDPMDCRPPGSSSMGFSRQEYWSGLPFPSPGDLSDPGIELWSPALQANALT